MGKVYSLDDANRDLVMADLGGYVNLEYLENQDRVIMDGHFTVAELEIVLTIAKKLRAST